MRLTNQSLNAYGTWIVTAGLDISQYLRNPVLLHMHRRGTVVGIVKDVRVEGEEITGELAFDEATELSRQLKAQYEFGSLRMVSVGVDILEMSEEQALLKPGQTRMTVTKSRLEEVSIVDIGANPDAIVLSYGGRTLDLAAGSESNVLPTLHNNSKDMDLKTIALSLGLPETATEADVQARIAAMDAEHAELEAARRENEEMRLAAITAAVDAAVTDRRLSADKRGQFIALGKKVGIDDLNDTLNAMNPAAKVSSFVAPQAGGSGSYRKLSEVPADQLLAMRENDPAQYKKLFAAEYGFEAEL